jgi:ubiquinone/menaquinone biosynthesis C-methylase UbiE
MADTITSLTYNTLQDSKSYLSFAHKTFANQVRKWIKPNNLPTLPVPPELIDKLNQRSAALRAVDLQDAENGVYPKTLLFDQPWTDYLAAYPLLCLDMLSIWNRSDRQEYQKFDRDVDTSGYPSYYVQNFHHQTNGYLSDRSAELYDLQVEILFGGTADAMRRRVLAPLKEGLTAFEGVPAKEIKILDAACGTARTLQAIRSMLPQAQLCGLDLSPAYLRKANEQLSRLPGELPQLLQGNIEELPFVDNYFHAITCVFLFHELPPNARQKAISECYRVLKPGGTFILCDSIQMSDSPELKPLMDNFHTLFHEPYYRSYMEDDLNDRLTQAGFTSIQPTQVHMMSKYLISTK